MVNPSLYPFASNWWEKDGLKLHYVDEGQGSPVVMVHGNPTWSFYYRNAIKMLRSTHRCIVPDHIGCGLSDKPDDSRYGYRLKDRIDNLEGLLESLNLKEPITLMVHDWGGMIGMGYAIRHPEKIKKLAIFNTAAFHLPSSKAFPPALRLGRDTWLGALMIRAGNAFCRVAARVCVKRKPLEKDVKAGYLEPYNSWKNRIATLRFVQDIPLKPEDPSYADVEKIAQNLKQFQSIPMLICWGIKDFVFSEHFLLEWQKRFPTAEVHRFEDAGHYILEDAWDEVKVLLQKFIGEGRPAERLA